MRVAKINVRVLLEPKLAILTALWLILTLLVLATHREVCIRWWGMLMQFVGIYAVLHELRGALNLFNPNKLRDDLTTYVKRLTGQSGMMAGTGSMTIRGGALATLIGRATMSPNATLPERIAALENAVDNLFNGLNSISTRIGAEKEARESALSKLDDELRSEVQKVRQDITTASTGSAWVSLFGIFWLVLGVFLATAAPELARWLSPQ